MPSNIPRTIDDVLDDNATFDPAALAAVRTLARSKPWQGTDAERLAKFNACAESLASAYGIPRWTVAIGARPRLDRRNRRLIFARLSVVTFLHAMAATRGLSHFGCFRWSINLFRRCFPASFARCDRHGPYMIRTR